MGRPKWKGPFVNKKLTRNRIFLKRSSSITSDLLGKTVWCHDGKAFGKTEISNEMLGHKIGEFVGTRAEFCFKKKKKR